MRILIVTPLYPPDIEPSACYARELAERLSINHTVTVLTYGALPEPTPKVTIRGIRKDIPLLMRLIAFTTALFIECSKVDVVFFENGPSVELPVSIISLFFSGPLLIAHEGDIRAQEFRKKSWLRTLLYQRAHRKRTAVLSSTPHSKPEILPFTPKPAKALAEYEQSWKRHLVEIDTLLLNV